MDHGAEKTNIRDGLGLPLCKETFPSPSLLKQGERSRRKREGEKSSRAGGRGPASSLEAGMLEDGQETRTEVK